MINKLSNPADSIGALQRGSTEQRQSPPGAGTAKTGVVKNA